MSAVKTKKTSEKKIEANVSQPKVKGQCKALGHGVGRRKSCVARVYLNRGKGAIVVNGRPVDEYFDTDIARKVVRIPFSVASGTASRFDVKVLVHGGGLSGQADAIKLGISRALLNVDADLKSVLREHGLLTVDARLKERKKYGQKGARRRFQFVKR